MTPGTFHKQTFHFVTGQCHVSNVAASWRELWRFVRPRDAKLQAAFRADGGGCCTPGMQQPHNWARVIAELSFEDVSGKLDAKVRALRAELKNAATAATAAAAALGGDGKELGLGRLFLLLEDLLSDSGSIGWGDVRTQLLGGGEEALCRRGGSGCVRRFTSA